MARLLDFMSRSLQLLIHIIIDFLGTATAVTLTSSLFPGLSGIASMGTKSAYYGVRAANSLTNLALRLKRSANLIWKVSTSIIKLTRFTTKNMKKLILASNSVNIGRLLPLLPPVVLGIYVLFGVFWPSRVVFFTKKQRLNHMSTRTNQWTIGKDISFYQICQVSKNSSYAKMF